MEASKRPTYSKHVLETYGPQEAWSQGFASAEENVLISVVKKDLLKKMSMGIVSISITISGWQQDLQNSWSCNARESIYEGMWYM